MAIGNRGTELVGVIYVRSSLLPFAKKQGAPRPSNVLGVGSQCRAMRVGRAIAFGRFPCAAADDRSIDFIESYYELKRRVGAGRIPFKRAVIQHFFRLGFFHFVFFFQ